MHDITSSWGPPQIKSYEIQLGKVLGRGAYGLVYEGVCRALPVAIKLPQLRSQSMIKSFTHEVDVMSKINHPNVCLFLGACLEDPEQLQIVTEKLEGDLLSLISQKKLAIFERLKLAKDAAQGIAWLHGMGVIHRDLKTKNILYDRNGNAKVCDFGLAQFIRPEVDVTDENNKPKGTPLYMAPEVLQNKRITKKVDVYSFGIVLWELLTGEAPFPSHEDMKSFTDAICIESERPSLTALPLDVPKSCKKLLQRCWHPNPDVRPEFEEIVDELDIIMIETSIKDEGGAEFWKNSFLKQQEIGWEEFFSQLYSFIGASPPPFPCKREEQYRFNCLKEVFADKGKVKLVHFGRMLHWYGPLTRGQDSFLEKVFSLLSAHIKVGSRMLYYFHGDITQEKAENILHEAEDGTFLVRFSKVPGCFSISHTIPLLEEEDSDLSSNEPRTSVDHIRINRFFKQLVLHTDDGLMHCEDEDLPTLIEKAAPRLGLRRVPHSPFRHLFTKTPINFSRVRSYPSDDQLPGST
eukprot:TRINITY_DN3774_c0_g1_i1.p1 TRINITY_DN3774_c0_g1~~TRINITY_DN3774_c0_g1_i1.p1  ORF type:complete len:520 (+),score=48.87 TRINITY_DN3774_c0_g1_i1:147-1706(+)